MRLARENILLIVVSILLLSVKAASGFYQIDVIPPEIMPGDAFVVRVTGPAEHGELFAETDGKQYPFSSCGNSCSLALIGSDMDMKPGAYTVRVKTGEVTQHASITVNPASFKEIHLNLPEEKVTLNPEDLKRAEQEAEKLSRIWKQTTGKVWEGSFIMPLGNDISTAFGVKRIMNRKKISVHKGIDIKGRDGEAVRASNSGTVVLAEDLFFGGNTIVLDHGLGVYTVYMHLSGFNITSGDAVLKGGIIGFVGSSGRSTGPHLHFGVKVFDMNINPASLVRLRL